MYATWPMVFAALVGGFIVGALMPANNEPAKLNLPGSSTAQVQTVGESGKKSSSPKEPESQPAEKRDTEKDTAELRQVSACQKEAWPYFSSTCLDPAASIREPVQIVKARKEDPAIMTDKGKEESNMATAQSPETESATPRAEAEAEAQAQTKPKPSRPRAQAGTQENVAVDAAAVERQIRPEQQPQRRARVREREAELNDDDLGRPARVILTPDGRKIHVYPHARGEQWSGPPPQREW